MNLKKHIEYILIAAALLSIAGAILFCCFPKFEISNLLKALAAVLAFNFFMYKLITGWLIINLNVKIEPTRQTMDPENTADHLALKLTLSKGSTDSLWLKSVEIRLSEINPAGHEPTYALRQTIQPYNTRKMQPRNNDYWDGTILKYYTLSSNEEVEFAAYTTIEKNKVYLAETLILGIRPFYNIERSANKFIQWRSSAVILPVEVKAKQA